MEQPTLVYKNNKGRGLRIPVSYNTISAGGPYPQGLLHCGCLDQHLIQNTCADTQGMVLIYRLNQFQHTVNSLPCHGRNKHLRRIFHIFQFHGNILEIFIHGLFVLFNGIPFIDGNNCRLPSFVGNACNLGILIL